MQSQIIEQKRADGCNLRIFTRLLLNLAALLIVVFGFVWKHARHFHNGDECDMTYSMREFVEVDVGTSFEATSPIARDYKLYKFFDRRDPRYRSLLNVKQPLSEHSDFCGAPGAVNVVLFIPGHWGSYTQSRSLGAHGVKLTGSGNGAAVRTVINSLGKGMYSGTSETEESFIYEVFSVDFAEQGAALHGQFLLSQSHYVNTVVRQISHVCSVDSITLIGHSMGGIVARLVPVLHPENVRLIRNIVTLASPHSNPIYALDYSIREVYELLEHGWEEETLVVSVSTGLKDDMIIPTSSFINRTSSYSVLATKLLHHGEFGMDHQAITWCSDVLHSLRVIIWALSTSRLRDGATRLQNVKHHLGEDSFAADYFSTKDNFVAKFGSIYAGAIEAGMVYNIPHLLSWFCILGGMRYSLPGHRNSFALASLPFTTILGWYFSDVSSWCVVILTLVANLVHELISIATPTGFWRAENQYETLLLFPIPSAVAMVLVFVLRRMSFDALSLQYTELCLFLFSLNCTLCCLLLVVGNSDTSRRTKDLSFVSVTFIVTIVTSLGPASLILWGARLESRNWQSIVMIFSSASLYYRNQRKRIEYNMVSSMNYIWAVPCVMLVAGGSMWLMARGHGYRLLFFPPAITALEITGTQFDIKTGISKKDM